MSAYDCRTRRESSSPNAPFINRHEYDNISGWCAWGCGCRRDGRVVKLKTGDLIYPGNPMTAEEEVRFRAYAFAENDKKRPARRSAA